MREHESEGGGWTFGRILGLIVGLAGMGGFGICSLFGLIISIGSGMGIFVAFVLPGLGLTYLFFLLVRAMMRGANKRPPP